MHRTTRFIATVFAGVLIALSAIGAGVRPAGAQQYPAPSATTPPSSSVPAPAGPPASPAPPPPPAETMVPGFQVSVTPYLWLAGLNMAITTPLRRASTINASAGAFQLLGDLDGVPFMGAIEVRGGPFSVLGDVFHVPLGVPITTRNVLFQGGSSAIVENIGTADLLYHVLEGPVQSIDAGVGFRAWGVSTTTTLNAGILPSTQVKAAGGWADPLIAARYHRDFGNGFGLTAYGDFGGFDVKAHVDWQIVGTLDYAWKSWATLRLGYRSLNVAYQPDNSPIGFNVHMKGPILAATFRF